MPLGRLARCGTRQPEPALPRAHASTGTPPAASRGGRGRLRSPSDLVPAGLSARVAKPLDANSQRRSSGISAHFLAWPRCMNIQAEQSAAGAIGLRNEC